MHHHWHLHIMLGAWPLQRVCVVIIAGLGLALLLPGLAVCGAPQAVTGAVGTAQVSLLTQAALALSCVSPTGTSTSCCPLWSLQRLCLVVSAGLNLALLLPGLAVCGVPQAVTGAVGTAQVVAQTH